MAVSARSQYDASVVANQNICREHFRLLLRLPAFPPTSPGQFIQIAGRDLAIEDWRQTELDWSPGILPHVLGRELQGPLAVLRRPFSLAGRSDSADGVTLEIIHRVVGVATKWMSELVTNDRVGILGPLGNRFDLPKSDQPAILVGGGVGIPPMLYLAQALAGHQAVSFSGATTRDLLPLKAIREVAKGDLSPQMSIQEFADCGIPSVISTDDGSFGFKGFVTDALEAYLDHLPPNPAHPVIYTCGPEPMMKRVARIALDRGVACQVAVERAMACGMGTCQSCVIRVKLAERQNGRDWAYRLACTDGPIFRAADLLW